MTISPFVLRRRGFPRLPGFRVRPGDSSQHNRLILPFNPSMLLIVRGFPFPAGALLPCGSLAVSRLCQPTFASLRGGFFDRHQALCGGPEQLFRMFGFPPAIRFWFHGLPTKWAMGCPPHLSSFPLSMISGRARIRFSPLNPLVAPLCRPLWLGRFLSLSPPYLSFPHPCCVFSLFFGYQPQNGVTLPLLFYLAFHPSTGPGRLPFSPTVLPRCRLKLSFSPVVVFLGTWKQKFV